MLVRNKNQLLSNCDDSILETKQYVEILESAGYTKETIDDWMPTTVLGTIQLLYKASERAHKSGDLPWALQYSLKKFCNKFSGSIKETLYEAIVNSQRFQRLLPGQPEHCFHRGEFKIADLEFGSPDKILLLSNGEYLLSNIKSSPDPKKKISANKANTSNIFGWQRGLKISQPESPFVEADVQLVSNVSAYDQALIGTRHSLHGNSGNGSLCQIVDNQLIQFWKDFWNAIWETSRNTSLKVSKFNGLYTDQKAKLYDPIQSSLSRVLTALGACGIGKTDIMRELVREDYKHYNIDGKGIYGIDFPRLALGSQHNDRFNELGDVYYTLVNTSSNNYKHHFTASQNLQLNVSTTDIKKIAQYIIQYAFGSQTVPMLILNTDKGLPRLRKAFEMIKSGEVFLNEDANPEWTYKKVVKLCKQFHHDEAHNLVTSSEPEDRKAKTFKKELVKSLLYFNKIFDKSVYWTATRKLNGSDYDMSNINIFGLVEAEYSFGEAISNGRILPCYVKIVMLTIDDWVGLSKFLNSESREIDEDLTFLIKAVRDHKSWCDNMGLDCQVMFFSRGTKCLPYYKDVLSRVFSEENIYVDYVTAETSQQDRNIRFNKYQNSKFSVLMNYDIIAEGIDIHSTTAVVIGRGMNDIKVVQASSRGIRLSAKDRQSFKEGKIKVGDETGWEKPYSWLYLFENEAVAEDTIRVSDVEKVLFELQKNNMTYDFRYFINKSSGDPKLREPNPQDDSPEVIDILEERLKIRIGRMLADNNVKKLIDSLDASDDDYFVKGLEVLCK